MRFWGLTFSQICCEKIIKISQIYCQMHLQNNLFGNVGNILTDLVAAVVRCERPCFYRVRKPGLVNDTHKGGHEVRIGQPNDGKLSANPNVNSGELM